MATFDSEGRRTNYKPDAVETGSLFLSLSCITLMAMLFGRKTSATNFASLNYARGLVVCLYVTSWLFSLMAAVLAQTNNNNFVSCSLSIWICIFLYAGSKILIYLFLIERVHVVTAVGVTRWNCPMFKFNIVLLSPYLGLIILAVLYRVAFIEDRVEFPHEYQYCKIGLELIVSGPLIAYDALLNLWLTALFVRALISSSSQLQGPTKSKLRDVARRTLIGSILSLIFSTANIASIAAFKGEERGVLCLALCTLDVTLNAVTIHWVTSRGSGPNSNANPRVTSSNGDRTSRIEPQFGMIRRENRASQAESHISVSIESYVEEYHQMHIASKLSYEPNLSPNRPSFYNFDDIGNIRK